MKKRTYGTLAEATLVDRPECAEQGDLLVVPPDSPLRHVAVKSLAKLGMSVGESCRAWNHVATVRDMFLAGPVPDSPLVLRIGDVIKTRVGNDQYARLISMTGNSRNAKEDVRATVMRCTLSPVYNGKTVPMYVDEQLADSMVNCDKVGPLMARLAQSTVTVDSDPGPDVAAAFAWRLFKYREGVVHDGVECASTVPEVVRADSGGRPEWDVGGEMSRADRTMLAAFLSTMPLADTMPSVRVRGRFLAEACRRGCSVLRCPQADAFSTRARLTAAAKAVAEGWRCRAKALAVLSELAARDLAVARARAANFEKLVRGVADAAADRAFHQCVVKWKM